MTLSVERLFITWFTSAADEHSHAVTDERAARGYRTGTDPHAICGATVTPVPMTTPPGPRCVSCERFARARATMTDFAQRIEPPRRRRSSWLRRLFCPKPPARSSSPPGPSRA